MEQEFIARARNLLEAAPADATIVVAVVTAGGCMISQENSTRPRDLAQVAASLANAVVERIDMTGSTNHAATGLLIACTDAERAIREALGDG